MLKRIIFDILLFLFVIACPWWVTAFFAIAILYYLKSFNEIVIFGVMADLLYGNLSMNFNLWDYKYTLCSLILLLTSYFIKKRLKFYNR